GWWAAALRSLHKSQEHTLQTTGRRPSREQRKSALTTPAMSMTRFDMRTIFQFKPRSDQFKLPFDIFTDLPQAGGLLKHRIDAKYAPEHHWNLDHVLEIRGHYHYTNVWLDSRNPLKKFKTVHHRHFQVADYQGVAIRILLKLPKRHPRVSKAV